VSRHWGGERRRSSGCVARNEMKDRVRNVSVLLRLDCHSKEFGDQCDLPSYIPFGHALALPFPHHVHDFVSLYGAPRGLEREKAHARFGQASENGWMNRWSCSIRLLRYFTCRNATCSGRAPAAFRSATALG
jgi:hypothetical protein